MKTLSTLAMAISLIFAAPAFAEDAHHPQQAAEAKAATAKPNADTAATVQKMKRNVSKMQGQLDRIGKAKTDEARQELMTQHLQTMQQNMQLAHQMQAGMMDCEAMHGGMHNMMHGGMHSGMKDGMMEMMMGGGAPSGTMPERMQQMEKRMEMMEMMMRRQEGAPAPTPAK